MTIIGNSNNLKSCNLGIPVGLHLFSSFGAYLGFCHAKICLFEIDFFSLLDETRNPGPDSMDGV